jgi:hypothetical protein
VALLEQMTIFDFIEKPQKHETPESKMMFEMLFGNISGPVSQCVNCLCMKCANNVEEVWHKVKPEEQKEPCFNCDECSLYTGKYNHRVQRKEDCACYIMSDYAARLKRKKMKFIKNSS